MPMLRALMSARNIAENLLATAEIERRLTDILHISELLQEAGSQLESEHALVRWLAQHNEPVAMLPASNYVLEKLDKASGCKSSPFINRKVWNTRFGSRILRFITHFRVQDGLFIDRHSYEGGAGP